MGGKITLRRTERERLFFVNVFVLYIKLRYAQREPQSLPTDFPAIVPTKHISNVLITSVNFSRVF